MRWGGSTAHALTEAGCVRSGLAWKRGRKHIVADRRHQLLQCSCSCRHASAGSLPTAQDGCQGSILQTMRRLRDAAVGDLGCYHPSLDSYG